MGHKWLPLGFPLRRTRACICLVVKSLPQFKTNGIWARRSRELSDQVSADRTAHPDRWLEDAPASYHEVGLVPRDLMDVVRQPRILIILLNPISAAASGIRSIQPVESQPTGKSPMTRSPCSSERIQPISSTDQRGLSLSSACLSWSEADDRQPNPTSRTPGCQFDLPVR